jgi:hypothetical protein
MGARRDAVKAAGSRHLCRRLIRLYSRDSIEHWEVQVRRRSFLKTGLVGGATAAAGLGALSLWPSRLGSVPAGLRVLSPKEHAVLAAVAARICPGRPGVAPDAAATGVPVLLDAELAFHDPDIVDAVRGVLGLFESGVVGLLFGERVRPFTQLGPDAQDAALQAWRSSAVTIRRSSYKLLHGLVAGTHFGQPASWPAVGYGGPPSPVALRQVYASNLVDLEGLLAPDERRAQVEVRP